MTERVKPTRPWNFDRVLATIGTYVAALAVAAAILLPIGWLFVSSVTPEHELPHLSRKWIPDSITWHRYQALFTGVDAADFRKAMLNSLSVALGTTVVCLTVATLAAYAFARLRVPRRDGVLFGLLTAHMLPPIALVIPLYLVLSRVKMLDTLTSLIAIYSALISPFAVWIMKAHFESLPRDIEDAAMVDGCSRLGVLFRILLPISAPGVAATTLFCFLMSWEEFLFALLFTYTMKAKTAPVFIAEFVGRHSVDYGMMAAGGVLAAIPPVLIALMFQRYIVSGLTAGMVKQ